MIFRLAYAPSDYSSAPFGEALSLRMVLCSLCKQTPLREYPAEALSIIDNTEGGYQLTENDTSSKSRDCPPPAMTTNWIFAAVALLGAKVVMPR